MASNETSDAGKLALLRQEAAGIAHDFNNVLTVISGHSSLLVTAMPADDPMRSSVTEIQKAAERAAVLTQQLLELSRRKL